MMMMMMHAYMNSLPKQSSFPFFACFPCFQLRTIIKLTEGSLEFDRSILPDDVTFISDRFRGATDDR